MNIQRFTTSGAPNEVARLLLRSGLSIPAMRAMSPLEENAQKLVDQAVVKVGLERLVVAADVMASGLVFPLTDPLGVMEVQWEKISKAGGAQRTMAPNARGERELPDRIPMRIPVYLTTDDFSVNVRLLKASERTGVPIDTTLVEEATRRVNEGIEDAAINGAGLQVTAAKPNNNMSSVLETTPGLLNAPDLNTFKYGSTTVLNNDGSYTTKTVTGGSGLAWDDPTKTGPEIISDVLNMITQLQGNRKFGPYKLYVNTSYGNTLNNDYNPTFSTKTIRQRIEEIDAGGRLTIATADRIPKNRVVLVQMTSDVIDIIDGQAPTVVPWTSADGFTLFWLVLAIMIPRVRSDYDGNSGVIAGNIT